MSTLGKRKASSVLMKDKQQVKKRKAELLTLQSNNKAELQKRDREIRALKKQIVINKKAEEEQLSNFTPTSSSSSAKKSATLLSLLRQDANFEDWAKWSDLVQHAEQDERDGGDIIKKFVQAANSESGGKPRKNSLEKINERVEEKQLKVTAALASLKGLIHLKGDAKENVMRALRTFDNLWNVQDSSYVTPFFVPIILQKFANYLKEKAGLCEEEYILGRVKPFVDEYERRNEEGELREMRDKVSELKTNIAACPDLPAFAEMKKQWKLELSRTEAALLKKQVELELGESDNKTKKQLLQRQESHGYNQISSLSFNNDEEEEDNEDFKDANTTQKIY